MPEISISSATASHTIRRNPAITHVCPQCPSPHVKLRASRALWLLSQLPSELLSLVVESMIVPQRPCLEHIFGTCLDQWRCPKGSHMDLKELIKIIIPCPRLTSLSTFFYNEGHAIFFRSHTFVFDNCYIRLLSPHYQYYSIDPRFPSRATRADIKTLDLAFQKRRDCYATRLLDFVDRPDWEGTGSENFRINGRNRMFGDIDGYRHTIQHLVFTASGFEGDSIKYRPDWNWPLKVNWQRFTMLRTLVLDLRYYSFSPRYPDLLTQNDYDLKIKKGAKGMECLKLQLLVIYGVCSGPFYNDEPHQRRMISLFETALDVRGVLEFRDSATMASW